jgi:hypothetical protein
VRIDSSPGRATRYSHSVRKPCPEIRVNPRIPTQKSIYRVLSGFNEVAQISNGRAGNRSDYLFCAEDYPLQFYSGCIGQNAWGLSRSGQNHGNPIDYYGAATKSRPRQLNEMRAEQRPWIYPDTPIVTDVLVTANAGAVFRLKFRAHNSGTCPRCPHVWRSVYSQKVPVK